MVCTHALNIPVVKAFVSLQQGDYRFAHILGLYFESENAKYHQRNHIVAVSVVIQLATLYKSSLHCFLEQCQLEISQLAHESQSEQAEEEQDKHFVGGQVLGLKPRSSGPSKRAQQRGRAQTSDGP